MLEILFGALPVLCVCVCRCLWAGRLHTTVVMHLIASVDRRRSFTAVILSSFLGNLSHILNACSPSYFPLPLFMQPLWMPSVCLCSSSVTEMRLFVFLLFLLPLTLLLTTLSVGFSLSQRTIMISCCTPLCPCGGPVVIFIVPLFSSLLGFISFLFSDNFVCACAFVASQVSVYTSWPLRRRVFSPFVVCLYERGEWLCWRSSLSLSLLPFLSPMVSRCAPRHFCTRVSKTRMPFSSFFFWWWGVWQQNGRRACLLLEKRE